MKLVYDQAITGELPMLKILFLLLSFSTFGLAQARPCKVYGITDGPQRLECSFPNMDVTLSCVNGSYRINGAPVTQAFHLEVEEGTVPLVFKFSKGIMTVMMDEPVTAELDLEKAQTQGTCKR